jgi:methionine-rich copper-binding protein CopC
MKRIMTGLAIAAATAVFSLSPLAAQAHDEVVSTSPAAGTTVAPGDVELAVTFNEDIMKNPDLSGEVIEVVDSLNDTIQLQAGCLTVSGPTLSTKVNIQNPGDYTVNWRSVSNDGHPNEGTFAFTVSDNGKNSGSDVTTGVTAAVEGNCPVVYSAIDTAAGVTATDDPSAEPLLISARVDDEAVAIKTDGASLVVGYFAGAIAAISAVVMVFLVRKRL